MRSLKGAVAVVTGASRGIGPYICRALAAEGAHLVLVARDAGGLDQAAASIEAMGRRALALPADLAEEGAPERVAERAEAAFGRVDILVNNAGIQNAGPFAELDPLDAQRIVRVNLEAPVLLARAVLPGMLARRRGHVVNVSSLAGKAPTPYSAVYSGTKAGLAGFTHSLKAELHGTGVSASVVLPGFIREAGMFHDSTHGKPARTARLVGTSSPEQVARAVVKAIKRDRVEVVVNRGPMRAIFAFSQLAPDLVVRLAPRFGVEGMMRDMSGEVPASPSAEQTKTGG